MMKKKSEEMTKSEQTTAEKKELRLLLKEGVEFEIEDKNIFGKTRRNKYRIKEPCLSVLDRVSRECIDIDIEQETFDENVIGNARKAQAKYSKTMARIVSIFILGMRYKNPFLLWWMTRRIYNSMTNSNLKDLCVIILTMSNMEDFIGSIGLVAGNRTTAPNTIEETRG